MVSRNNTILAAQFNTLQNRIAQLLGNGFGDFGYGQPVSSSIINPPSDPNEFDADNITVEHINNLRNDLAKIYRHQNGSNLPIGEFTSQDIIGADQSATDVTVTDNFEYTYENSDTQKGINDLISRIRTAEVDRFTIAKAQYEVQSAIIDERATNWNDTIFSEFTVSFDNEDQRRHFFNAGGEIRFEGTVDIDSSQGGSFDRNIGWRDMLQNVGVVRFSYTSVLQVDAEPDNDPQTPSTTGVTFPDGVLGNYDLTSDYKIIFKKNANAGEYSESFWQIEAKENSSSEIQFKVSLRDIYDENVTEPITADIQFEYSYRRANGEVVAPIPAVNVKNSFE